MRNQFNDKPPLLLIHGFGSSADTWRAQMPALADAGHQVFAIDLLGLGYSEKPPGEEYSIRLWADMVLDFIDDVLGGKPTVLFGNSIGGITSLKAAATEGRKQLVRAIVLMNTAAGMNTKFIAKDPRSSLLLRVICTPVAPPPPPCHGHLGRPTPATVRARRRRTLRHLHRNVEHRRERRRFLRCWTSSSSLRRSQSGCSRAPSRARMCRSRSRAST